MVNQTHLIYRALGEPHIETEPCKGICAFCGTEIQEGVKLENTVSDAFTNYDLLTDRTASHVCAACNACVREPKLRRMNFIAIGDSDESDAHIIYFKRDEIERYLFQPLPTPFIFAVTESYKKHMSFRARVNYSNKLYYVQKEDTQILFSPNKYKPIFDTLNRLYLIFSKNEIELGNYYMNRIKKYGLNNFQEDEGIIKEHRGTLQFNLLIYALNSNKNNSTHPKKAFARTDFKG